MPPQKLAKELDKEMSACYLLTNPRDASINVTGFSSGSSGHRDVEGPIFLSAGSSSLRTRKMSSPSTERYIPVLAVKRRLGPTTVSAPVVVTHGESEDSVKSGDTKTNVPFARHTAAVECFQAKTPIAQRARNCSRSTNGVGTLYRPLTDVRTGFMRTMSRPTPGELDLKHHQEKQALDKLKLDMKRDLTDDPDKLDMNDIMKLIDNKEEKRSARNRPRAAKRRVAHASLVSDVRVETLPNKTKQVVDMDSKYYNSAAVSEYKHRLHALSAQMRSTRQRAVSAVGRNTCNDPCGIDRMALRLSPTHRNERKMRIHLLSLPKAVGADVNIASLSSDNHSVKSWTSNSRLSPRSTATLSMKDVSVSSRKNARPRYPDPIYIPSANDIGDSGDSRVRLSMRNSSHVTREASLLCDLDPENYARCSDCRELPKSSSISYTFPEPTVPPTNTPVSSASDGEFDGVFYDDNSSVQTNWSRSCSRSSRKSSDFTSEDSGSPTPAKQDNDEKAKINVVMPSVT